MAARPDVFVSYSRRDKAFVEDTLFLALVAAGKDVRGATCARPRRG